MELYRRIIVIGEALRAADDAKVCECIDLMSVRDIQKHSIPAQVLVHRPALLSELAKRGIALDAKAFGDMFTHRRFEAPDGILAAIDAAGIRLELDQEMLPTFHHFPLDWAIKQKYLSVANWMVDRGALPGRTHDTLADLLALDARDLFEKLVAVGVDLDSRGDRRNSLWHTMAERPLSRRPWAISALRARQVPQDMDSYDRTPLSAAIRHYFSDRSDQAPSLAETFGIFEGDLWHDRRTRLQLLDSRNWVAFRQLLDLAPLHPAQHPQLWKDLLSGFGENPDWCLPNAVFLLSAGIVPEKRQWAEILNAFLRGGPAALATLYAKAHPDIRIPWVLRAVLNAEEPVVVEAWLTYHGRPDIAMMLKATGMLSHTPVSQWAALVNGLTRKKALDAG